MTTATEISTGLAFVDAPVVPNTFNVLLYGPPKSGKSTAAATAPGPVMWVNAEGPGALAYPRKVAAERQTALHEVRITRGDDVPEVLREVVRHIRSGTKPVPATVVVDTLGKLREALVRQIVQQGSKMMLPQYGEVARILNEFVQTLRDEPVNVVLIAHEDVKDEGGERIVQPLIGGALTQSVPGEVDVFAYTGVTVDDDGVARYMGQLVEGRGRRAGDRSGGLGHVRELDLSEWLEAFRAALSPDDVPWEGGNK